MRIIRSVKCVESSRGIDERCEVGVFGSGGSSYEVDESEGCENNQHCSH